MREYVQIKKAGLSIYEQIGLELNGESPGDTFGRLLSLSGDGTRLVVAATGKDGNGDNSGQVSVYHLNQTISSFIKVGMEIDGVAPGDSFGSSVSISADGTTFIVGAPFHDVSGIGTDCGHARVFRFDITTNTYIQIGPNINGEAEDDRFGWSVDISKDGSTIAVGAIRNKERGTDSGHVRVFTLNATANGYVQVGSDINGGGEFELFGYSVRMSANGTTLVVGAPNNRAGRVRVYQFNTASNNYVQVGSDINGKVPEEFFGNSLSVSADGTIFVVGISSNSDNGSNSGQVRVFQLNQTINSYEQIGLGINGNAVNDNFGVSVSISTDGGTLIVGAPGNIGRVRVYNFDRSIRRYVQVKPDIYGVAEGDIFGGSVSISANGTTFAVGAHLHDGSIMDSNIGQVRVYRKTALTTPTFDPTRAPTFVPTKAPTVPSPILLPVNTPTNCGLFGFNWFCPRRGKCGLFRRLFRIHGC